MLLKKGVKNSICVFLVGFMVISGLTPLYAITPEENITQPEGEILTISDTSWYDEVSQSYTLDTMSKWLGFVQLVNQGYDFLNTTIVLALDIEDSTSMTGAFKGTFDGQGYMITIKEGTLFERLEGATLQNVFIHGQGLAHVSENTSIKESGFYLETANKQTAALILESTNTTIHNSFVLANIEAKTAAGFVLSGSATIENSYVSGYIEGTEVYGFGKEVTVNNSYSSVSLQGKQRILFTTGEQTGCFYDVQINDIEDEKATPLYTSEMISGELKNASFNETSGRYPESKAKDIMKEKAQQLSLLSTLSIKTKSNLSAWKGTIETEEVEGVEWKKGSDEITATRNTVVNRFAIQEAKQITGITIGESTTNSTTQITYPVVMGTYYKTVKKGEVVPSPTTHEEAIEAGWKIIYWDGAYTQTGVQWNHEYDVLSSNLSGINTVGTTKTNYGKNGGKITLTGTYDFGEVMRATIENTNTAKGTMYFESAATLDASTWTEVQVVNLDGTVNTVEYTVTNNEASKYLRARFVSDDTTGYQGTLIAKSNTSVKTAITSVHIVNRSDLLTGKYTLGDALVAGIMPSGKENEVTFSWYHEGSDEVLATGRNYTLKAEDIGKKVYVKATAKTDGELKGEVSSRSTGVVESIQNEKPEATSLVLSSKDDITVTVKMNTTKGLYRYGIATSPTGEIKDYPMLARANTNATMTGLLADTTYYIYIQQVGEAGYLDSAWSDDYITVKTDPQHVRGDVVITGSNIYNQSLTARVDNELLGQTGELVWYRLDSDGNREETSLANGDSYTLVKEDIGKKLEVVFVASGNYAGEISSYTDTIGKEEKTKPDTNLVINDFDDTWIKVQLPINSDNEKYIIGVSTTKDGVPVEVLDNGAIKELASDEVYTITNLQRDSDYYLFIRYASNETHEESEWVDTSSSVHRKTNKKIFVGTVDFSYENVSNTLRRGQTLTANVNPEDNSFNYKGTWTWKKVVNGVETTIDNFTLTDNKQGTKYVVPKEEELGTTYKVAFSATIGYKGSTDEVTSQQVEDVLLEQYEIPEASDIVMETIDDMSIKVSMDQGGGQYQFWYKKADTSTFDSLSGYFNKLLSDPDDGYIKVGNPVYSHTDVVIEGLERNSKYIVKVQRMKDASGDISDFAYSDGAGIFAITKKTEIAGNITIEGTVRYGETLQATYTSATYASTGSGSDSDGTWQWYRGTTKISGATTSSYTLTASDVGEILKVEYKMPTRSNFEGETTAQTRQVEKAVVQNPSVSNVVSTFNTTTKQIDVKITGSVSASEYKVYYRTQLQGETAPSFPSSEELNKWTESTSPTTTMTVDSDGREFQPQTEYVVYVIQTATPTVEGSAVISKEFKVGSKTQTGTITFTGRNHVNKEMVATLSSDNNQVGEWHWYYSNTDYTVINPSTWTELKSGYSPKSNSATSTLLVPNEAKGKYLKAKFVSTSDKHSGSVENVSSNTVTKTMTEKLEISGKGYAEQTIEVKLTGSDRDLTKTTTKPGPNQLFNNRVVQIQQSDGTNKEDIGTLKNVTKDSFQVTVPSFSSSYDEYYLNTLVNMPDTKIYTKEDGSFISDTSLKLMNNERIQFHYGKPISNATELATFISGPGVKSEDYVITDNINMSSISPISSLSSFSGTINGDYHTITGLKNPLMSTLQQKGVIKNIIFVNSSVNVAGNAAMIANQINGPATIQRVMAIDSVVQGKSDVGFLVGKSSGEFAVGNISTIKECMTAGGQSIGTGSGKAVGGVFGWNTGSVKVEDLLTIGTKVTATSDSNLGGIQGGGDRPITLKNIYVVPNFTNTAMANKGVISGALTSYSENSFTKVYYDSTVVQGGLNTLGGASGITTRNSTGANLFGDNGGWTYQVGFYPRLSWVMNEASANSPGAENIANLYAATRGAFVPLDSYTTANDLFNGNINGAVSVPEELQKPGYSYSSSNTSVLTVSNNGVITPKSSSGSAIISITYTDSQTGAKPVATFNFNAKRAMANFTNVSISGTPAIGKTLTSSVSPTTTLTYKWYRKLVDGTKTLISGATASSYTMQSEDAGYQIQVEVSASGYGTATSSWSNPVQVGAPTEVPDVKDITDSSAIFEGKGGINSTYEYAYATSSSGEKILVESKGPSVTLNNLARNQSYYVYARVPEGTGYSASGWSGYKNFTTTKTDVVGSVTFGTNINNGQQLSMSAPTTNDQEGTWTLERMSADGNTKIDDITYSSGTSISNYTLTSADVEYRIKATFTGSGDYQGSISGISDIVKKSNVSAPNEPTFVSSTDDSITVRVAGVEKYDIGIAESITGTILPSLSEQSGDTNLVIPNCSRNKNYYVYTRVSATTSTETSPWSAPTEMLTQKSAVSGTIARTGEEITDSSITFIAPNTNNQTGVWKLERMSDGSVTTISPSAYTVDETGRELTYTVIPKDAGSSLKATFSGTGDFNNTIDASTGIIKEAKQKEEGLPLPTNIVISNPKVDSFDVKTESGTEIYQYGYVLKDGDVSGLTIVDATAGAGIHITINGLLRNTEYDIYMRKAAKVGYEAGQWHKMVTGSTDKSVLTGTINYEIKNSDGTTGPAKVGIAYVNETYQASYESGTYEQPGDDSKGSWQWYANGKAIPGATNETYTIEPMLGDIEITVKYHAEENSDFKDTRSASIGTFTKPSFDVPNLPTVVALGEDGEAGSKLKITTTVYDDVYYYVQKTANTGLPVTITGNEADANEAKPDQWFKAEASNTLIVEADTDYVVYVARLEDGSHVSSSVISQRSVRSEKEDLHTMPSITITEADSTSWKVQQPKELQISNRGMTPTGNWQYYVTKDKDIESLWQNITSEIKSELEEGKESSYAYTKVTIPLKYSNDYYVKAVFTGNGAYKGIKTYVSDEKIVGTAIRGHVEMTNSDQISEIFVPIKVQYVYAKDAQGNAIVDETNGVWTWYRETVPGSETYEKISRENDTIGLKDEYKPTVEDVNKKMHAVYSGAPLGIYSGSVQSATLDTVERAEQNTPEALTWKQVNGTTIQINLPSNYKADGRTVAQSVVEYRKKGTPKWIENVEGESWIGRNGDILDADTIYEVRARFNSTSEYKTSAYSDVLEVTTGNQSFDEEDLSIIQPAIIESGTKISATFSGDGYDEGYFVIKDTLNNTLVAKEEGTVEGSSIKMDYTVTSGSIGQNIIVQYQAKDDAKIYGGYIEKATREVEKPKNIALPGTAELHTVRLHEDQLKVQVDVNLEYVLDTSIVAHSETSSKWQKLPADGEGKYTFTGLQTETNYYLHARIAETLSYRHSDESISAATKTWKSSQYTISYEGVEGAINGTPANPTQYTELSSDIVLADASKTGYIFEGWTTSEGEIPQKGITIRSGSVGNKTYIANWSIDTYTITYELNGGSVTSPNPIEYNVEAEDFTLHNPTKTGYTFTGWTWDGQATPVEEVTITKGSTTGDIHYTANWSINSYDAIFNSNGGNEVDRTIRQTYNEKLGLLPVPTKTGHRFEGWFSEATGGSQITEDTLMPLDGATYYAHWTIKEYTATFDETGGSEVVDITCDYDTKLGTLPTTTKRGYTLDGWFTSKTGGNQISEDTLMPENGATYYAHWTAIKYTATFDGNGGSNGTDITVDYDTKLGTLPSSTRTGYTLDGWFTEVTGGTQITEDTLMPENGATYYAHWTVNKYDVTFDSNGGSETVKQSVEHGSMVTKPQDPTRSYYTFGGWYSDADFTTTWDFTNATVTKATTLYAKWNADRYTISYNLDGGNQPSGNPTTYTVETETFALEDPTKIGYSFTGWTWAGQTTPVETVKVLKGSHGNLSYTANWKKVSYDVTFDSNGGSEIVKQTIGHGNKVTKPQDPTRNYYTFGGWYSDADFTTTWDFTNATVTKATTLYAKWNADRYTISYNLDGGNQPSGNPTTYTVETETFALEDPTKIGYSFTGWTWAGQTTPVETVKVLKGSHGNLSYTANWKKISYDVTFDSQGGSETVKQAVEHGSKVTKPQDPKKEGYVFIGWYRDASCTVEWNFTNDIVEQATTIYACYKLQLSNVESNKESGSHVEKGTQIILSSKEGATIYYSTDGSTPTTSSTRYTGAITIDKSTTIKAMASKENCIDSNISEFIYGVKGEVVVEVAKDSPVYTEVPKNELVEAVLTKGELREYQNGKDVKIRITCNTIVEEIDENSKRALEGRKVGKYYDISIYKQVGTKEEEMVTKLNKTIRITLTIPEELLAPEGTTRVFDVLRIHDGEAKILTDIDTEEGTVTIESDKFSTYILCYRDSNVSIAGDEIEQPSKEVKTGDVARPMVWYGVLLTMFGLLVIVTRKKKEQKK